MRFVIATLAVSLAAPAFAAPASPSVSDSFERGGVRYEYTHTDQANGVVLISGHSLDGNDNFSLRLAANHVTGTFSGDPVDFMVSKGMMAALATSTTRTIASN